MNRPPRLLNLAITLLGLAAVTITTTAEATVPDIKRPNILLVLVDDMGYSDIGCYGGEIETPTLDRLAADGVRYARFYNCAQCSPTRASVMTGLYPHQAGMGEMNARGPGSPFYRYLGSPEYLGFKKDGVVTLPEALREAGYQTFMSGKWHLGDTPDNWPSERGFDRTFSLVIGASEHFSGRYSWKNRGPIAPFILDGKKLNELPEDFYSTDTFTDYAMRFIEEADDNKPWFGYLAYTAPHWPLQAHEKDAAKYDDIYKQHPEALRRRRLERMKKMGLVPDSAVLPSLDSDITAHGIEDNREWRDRSMRHYAGMIDCVDQNLGKLVAFLEERGELDNTLILFLSDNGADTVRGPLWGQLDNAPFRRFKVWAHEGGICTPLIAHWPAGIPESQHGEIIGGYGHVIDLQPTCLDAAGAQQPETYNGRPVSPLEGISLIPSIRGTDDLPDDRLICWERMGNEGIRRGDWKLVRGYGKTGESGGPALGGERLGEWELYNVATDPGETQDLSSAWPERVGELATAYQGWARRIGVIPREQVVEKMMEFKEKQKSHE